MKKKILIFSIITVLMLVTISFASAVNTEKSTKKSSPLYSIRTKRAISQEKINNIKENIKTRFIRERIFFMPLLFKLNSQYNNLYLEPTTPYPACRKSISMPGCCLTER